MTVAAPRTTWIIFDFGGCLDSDGIHSRTLFLRAFQRQGLIDDTCGTIFQDAYTKTDRKMVQDGLTHGETLRQMNDLMCRMIADNFLKYLVEQGHEIMTFMVDKTLDVDRPEDIASAEEFLGPGLET